MSVKLNGLDQLMNRIKQMERQTVDKALKAGGEFLKEKVKENVPVRTGNLKENIIVSEVKNGIVEVGPDQQGDAFYGYFLEFGRQAGTTKRGKNKGRKYSAMAPRPFVGPVYENNKGKVQDVMGDVIKKDLGL